MIKHGGVYLRPHLADLLGALLEGMSSMENSAFSYLQFHAQAMNLTEEQLEVARLSVAKNTPLSDAVASCLHVIDVTALPAVLSKLTDLLQQGLGLPTLTATAKFIISLANTPSLSVPMKENTGPLMSALVNGLNDQSPSVRKVFAAALGYLCKVAKRKRVGGVIEGLLHQYTDADSTESKRLNSAIALQQIVNHASDVVKESFFPVIAPYAFLASHDIDTEISKQWTAIFDEMVPSKESGAMQYQAEIMPLILQTFESNSWALRQTSYNALYSLIQAAKQDFRPHAATITPLVAKALPGRIWAGKEKLFSVAIALCVQLYNAADSPEKTAEHVSAVVEPILRAVLDETKRQKTDYRREAIRAVGEIVDVFNTQVCVITEMRAVLQPIISSVISPTSTNTPTITLSLTDTEVEERQKSVKSEQLTQTIVYECLGRIYPNRHHSVEQQQHTEWTIQSLIQSLQAGLVWNVRVAILTAIKQVNEKVLLQETVLTPALCSQMIAAVVVSSGDMKQSAVRVAALSALFALLSRDRSSAGALFSTEIFNQIRSMLDARRGDPESGVLRLIDQIRSKLPV